ncbi:Swi five-dependent recombination repair protein Sfr1 [Schizosaccharomyces pombe]
MSQTINSELNENATSQCKEDLKVSLSESDLRDSQGQLGIENLPKCNNSGNHSDNLGFIEQSETVHPENEKALTPDLRDTKIHTSLPITTPFSKKRAREAKNILLKPFKSPLRQTASPQVADTNLKPSLAVTNLNSDETNTSSEPITSPLRTTPNSIKRQKRLFKSPISNCLNPKSDPEITQLLSRRLKLEKEVRNLQEQLITAETARKVEAKNEDKDLQTLIQKWKNAAQQAAEVLFKPMAERIRLAGGVTQSFRIEEGENKGQIQEVRTEFTMSMFLNQFGVPVHLMSFDEENGDWKS